ncbi:synaptotagmin-17-like isoform X2 [Montipora foliosa]|uniref:synaptotagmin-17-like isoform X2 n=1 Tax=Montipora foliosa TaxID=591990 RepID=UPI0035F14503
MGNEISHLQVPAVTRTKNIKQSPLQSKGAHEFEIPKRYDPDERRDSNHSNNKIDIHEIDVFIYSNPDPPDDVAIPASEPPPLGTLTFKVHYEKYEEQLKVHLIGAQRLPVRHLVTEPGVASHAGIIKCDPMVEICLLPDEKPVVESYIHFGSQNPQFNEHFTFKPYGHTRGEVLVSLNYNLTSYIITVGIERADVVLINGLHSTKKYIIKVTQICSGQKTKTKHAYCSDRERDPIFNSSLSFQVSPRHLTHTSLVLSLVGSSKIRGNKTIGRAILGPRIYESDSERSHWGRMIMSPMKTFQQWHALYL